MKNKLNLLLLIAFVVHCMTVGNSAEQSALQKQAPETALQALHSKLEQARAVLSEVQGLLTQEVKIMEGTREQKEQIKKSGVLVAERNRAADTARQEIKNIRDQIKGAERELAAYKKQIERCDSLQTEFAKTQKERLDSESKAQQAETKLMAAQNSLSELKVRLTELMTKSNEAKKQAHSLENARAVLEIEKARRSEALTRAENAVAMTEKAEKERLLLTGRLAEVEQNLSSRGKQQQDSQEQAKVEGEIENERKALAEIGDKIKREEKARKEAENTIVALKEQLKAVGKAARSSAQKEGEPSRLLARLGSVRKQRVEAEGRFNTAHGRLQESEQSLAALTNMMADVKKREINNETVLSFERTRIEGEIENEKKALAEIGDKIKREEKARKEAENTIVALKEQLKAVRKAARSSAQKEGDIDRLQARLGSVRKQRIEAEGRLKDVGEKLQESKKSVTALTNMIAIDEEQKEKDKETIKANAVLASELDKEIALMNEAAARLDNQNRNLKALEGEKIVLNQRLILVKEKLGREEKNINKFDEIRLQIAEQKKNRTDMEARLQQAAGEQDALEKASKQLNQALIEAGNLILKNKNDFKKAGKVADELQKEKELARKSTDLFREKEESVKQLAAEKMELQNKLNEAEAKLARQKEQIKTLEEKRRALAEEKKTRLAAEKKYVELARKEKEHKNQIAELKNKARSTTKESESLSLRADKNKVISAAGAGTPQSLSAGSSEAKAAQGAEDMAESSGKDILAVEQDILNKAQSRTGRSSGQDIGGTARYQEKKTVEQAGSRSRKDRLAQAEEHYALGIQKWDEDDLDGAIAEFKTAVRLNPDAAGAYYNISLACLRQGKKKEACDYAYKAGECYLRINNHAQATRMAVLVMKIDQDSPLIFKLRNKITAATR